MTGECSVDHYTRLLRPKFPPKYKGWEWKLWHFWGPFDLCTSDMMTNALTGAGMGLRSLCSTQSGKYQLWVAWKVLRTSLASSKSCLRIAKETTLNAGWRFCQRRASAVRCMWSDTHVPCMLWDCTISVLLWQRLRFSLCFSIAKRWMKEDLNGTIKMAKKPKRTQERGLGV